MVSSIDVKFVYYVISRAVVISQSCSNRIKLIFAATGGVIWAMGSTENEGCCCCCSFPNSLLFIN